jgi:hypothetical protein
MTRLTFLRTPQLFLESYGPLGEKFLGKGHPPIQSPFELICGVVNKQKRTRQNRSRQRPLWLPVEVAKTFHEVELQMCREELSRWVRRKEQPGVNTLTDCPHYKGNGCPNSSKSARVLKLRLGESKVCETCEDPGIIF